MRISDWSSDVCSSDLPQPGPAGDRPLALQPHRLLEDPLFGHGAIGSRWHVVAVGRRLPVRTGGLIAGRALDAGGIDTYRNHQPARKGASRLPTVVLVHVTVVPRSGPTIPIDPDAVDSGVRAGWTDCVSRSLVQESSEPLLL